MLVSVRCGTEKGPERRHLETEKKKLETYHDCAVDDCAGHEAQKPKQQHHSVEDGLCHSNALNCALEAGQMAHVAREETVDGRSAQEALLLKISSAILIVFAIVMRLLLGKGLVVGAGTVGSRRSEERRRVTLGALARVARPPTLIWHW